MKPTADIRSLDPVRPAPAVIAEAARVIRRGGLVVFPTHGLYGLGGDPFNPASVQRIFDLKGRSAGKALLVLISEITDLDRVALAPNVMAIRLMQHFWPGKLTILLPARKDLPEMLTGGTGKIGVRLVAHPVAAALARAVGAPVTGTSANISGTGGCASVGEIDAGLLRQVDLVLDAGPLAGGPGSTVVDATGTVPLVLREGAVPAEAILKATDKG